MASYHNSCARNYLQPICSKFNNSSEQQMIVDIVKSSLKTSDFAKYISMDDVFADLMYPQNPHSFELQVIALKYFNVHSIVKKQIISDNLMDLLKKKLVLFFQNESRDLKHFNEMDTTNFTTDVFFEFDILFYEEIIGVMKNKMKNDENKLHKFNEHQEENEVYKRQKQIPEGKRKKTIKYDTSQEKASISEVLEYWRKQIQTQYPKLNLNKYQRKLVQEREQRNLKYKENRKKRQRQRERFLKKQQQKANRDINGNQVDKWSDYVTKGEMKNQDKYTSLEDKNYAIDLAFGLISPRKIRQRDKNNKITDAKTEESEERNKDCQNQIDCCLKSQTSKNNASNEIKLVKNKRWNSISRKNEEVYSQQLKQEKQEFRDESSQNEQTQPNTNHKFVSQYEKYRDGDYDNYNDDSDGDNDNNSLWDQDNNTQEKHQQKGTRNTNRILPQSADEFNSKNHILIDPFVENATQQQQFVKEQIQKLSKYQQKDTCFVDASDERRFQDEQLSQIFNALMQKHQPNQEMNDTEKAVFSIESLFTQLQTVSESTATLDPTFELPSHDAICASFAKHLSFSQFLQNIRPNSKKGEKKDDTNAQQEYEEDDDDEEENKNGNLFQHQYYSNRQFNYFIHHLLNFVFHTLQKSHLEQLSLGEEEISMILRVLEKMQEGSKIMSKKHQLVFSSYQSMFLFLTITKKNSQRIKDNPKLSFLHDKMYGMTDFSDQRKILQVNVFKKIMGEITLTQIQQLTQKFIDHYGEQFFKPNYIFTECQAKIYYLMKTQKRIVQHLNGNVRYGI